MADTILLTGSNLTLEALAAVSQENARVELDGRVREKVRASQALVRELVEKKQALYGVTTGFGKLSEVTIDADQIRQLQVNLVRSHACGIGEPLSEAEVRAMMLLGANALSLGHSGVRPLVIETILELLNRRIHPVIPSRGSVGASGDLALSAHLALVLIGEGEALVGGDRMTGGEALSRAGRAPLKLGAKEGLAILNGTQAMGAVGGLSLLRAETLADTATAAGAMSLEALMGTDASLDEKIHRLRPHPGQLREAAILRQLVASSEIIASHRDCHRIQDAYSIRCMPQVHGAIRDVLAFARQRFQIEINSATDNPLIFAESGEVLAGGNFHGEPLALALDFLAIALADLGNISERRIERLVNPDLSGLPAFLAKNPGLNSGFMIAQVAAASLASENKVLAHPASVDSIPTSANKEDHVSMGMTAALKLKPVLENVEAILAIELLAGAQALDFLKPLKPGTGTTRVYEAVRRAASFLEEDAPLSPHIGKIRDLIRQRTFSRLVREA
ncbi:MAG: histidine ammonia-lyase [Acidobacteria bacterium]|nr:histidine ammonia-lyase [Acidobacteriota bacterium]